MAKGDCLVATDASVRPRSSKGPGFSGYSVVVLRDGYLEIYLSRTPGTSNDLEEEALRTGLGVPGALAVYSDSLNSITKLGAGTYVPAQHVRSSMGTAEILCHIADRSLKYFYRREKLYGLLTELGFHRFLVRDVC